MVKKTVYFDTKLRSPVSALVFVNLASLFISTSGVLGRSITISPDVTSFFRCIVASCLLLTYMKVVGAFKLRDVKLSKNLLLSGVLLAIHWATYFYSLQISNVSITIISLFTYPIMTTLLEPLFFPQKIGKINILSSILVLVGVVILVPEFSLSNDLTNGIIVGLVSALAYSLRNIASRSTLRTHSGELTLLVQLFVAACCLSPSLFYQDFKLTQKDVVLIIVLGLVTTTIGHLLFLKSLRSLTTSSASILASIQPVYAIILAVLILQEPLEQEVIAGGILILGAVVIQSIYESKTQ